MANRCILCDSPTVTVQYSFPLVFSDCRAVTIRPELLKCAACNHVQKSYSDFDIDYISSFYESYEMYPHGGGVEQLIALSNGGGGSNLRRSTLLGQIVSEELKLLAIADRTEVNILDFGCGSGNLLREIECNGGGQQNIKLFGVDVNPNFRDAVESVRGATFHTRIEDLGPTGFDCICVAHTLEHLLNPGVLLGDLRRLLKPGGFILIEVPDSRMSLFDLVIADHVSHFTLDVLTAWLRSLGFSTKFDNRISRELTVIARCQPSSVGGSGEHRTSDRENDSICKSFNWIDDAVPRLSAIITICKQVPSFYVFGSSIAASWLISCCGENVRGLIDEDHHRWGNFLRGKLIQNPASSFADSPVFYPMPIPVAEQIVKRNSSLRRSSSRVLW